MIKRKRAITLLLAVALFLSIWVIPTEQVYAKVALPAISPSRYIAAYTRASSGKVYAYTDSSLSQKTGGYIECATDECYIVEIKGNALKVSYPTPSKRKTKWFEREAFTYRDLASNGAKTKFKSTKKVTTYKRKDKNNKYGYIAKGDICYLLRGDETSDWLQVIYPTGNTYKMAWVKGGDIRTVIWPPQNNTTIEPTGVSLSKSSIKDYAGSSYKLSATVSPSNATNKNVSWSTGNSGIATVDGSGNVKLKAAGSTSITARTSNGKTASCSVTVIKKADPESTTSSDRKKVVDYMRSMATIKWKPKVTFQYYNGGWSWLKGKTYKGIPYTQKARSTSLAKFKKNLNGTTYVGPTEKSKYLGTDCSSSVSLAWKRVESSFGIRSTLGFLPGNNKISKVGKYNYTSSTGTKANCSSNGTTKMYKAYRKLKPGDAIVTRNTYKGKTSGHIRLVVSVSDNSLKVIEQSTYDKKLSSTWRVDKSYSFKDLYNAGYLPVRLSTMN